MLVLFSWSMDFNLKIHIVIFIMASFVSLVYQKISNERRFI